MRGGNPAPQIEWFLDGKSISKEVSSLRDLGAFRVLVVVVDSLVVAPAAGAARRTSGQLVAQRN